VSHQVVAAHERALGQLGRGRVDLAHRGLLHALSRLAEEEDPADRAAQALRIRLLMTLTTAEDELHGDGLPRLVEAQALAERLGDPALRFGVLNSAALRLLRRGDHAAALEAYAAAEALVGHARRRDAAVLHLNRGNLRLQRLDLAEARADLERCAALASVSPTHEHAATLDRLAFMAEHNLGYLEHLRGNLPRALQLMDTAARHAGSTSLAISALDKARVLIEAGLTDAADATLAGAEQEFRRGRLFHELGETELARAECALLGDRSHTARSLAAVARTRFSRRGNDRWRRVAELTLLTADQAAGRPPRRLIAPARRLAEEFAAEGLELQSRTAALLGCSALVAAGQVEQAHAWFASLHPISRSDPIGLKLQQRAVAAELSLRRGQASPAQSQVRLGLTELSRHQAQFGSLDLQMAGAVHGRRLVALDLGLALAAQRPAGAGSGVRCAARAAAPARRGRRSASRCRRSGR